MKKLYSVLVAFGGWWLSSCVSLNAVNTFSTSATTSLQQNTTLPTTFTDVYRQRVQEDSLDRHPFNRIPVVGIDFANRVRRDSLRSYQLADSLTTAGTKLLTDYFQALANLSATGSSFVPVRLKSPTFENFLQHSAIKLTADQVVSFNRITNLVGAAATGAYRRRKLGSLLEESHEDVRQLIGVLAFGYERLAAVVDISRDQQYGNYKNGMIRDPTLTYTQKRDLARQWLQTAKNTEQTQLAILTHVKALKTIQAGYDELYRYRHDLSRKELMATAGLYASSLQQLRADLEQLKPIYGRLHP
jgi:hypothetical protein